MNDPRIGVNGARPLKTVTGREYQYPNVFIHEIREYRYAIDPAFKRNPDAESEVIALIHADMASLSPIGDADHIPDAGNMVELEEDSDDA